MSQFRGCILRRTRPSKDAAFVDREGCTEDRTSERSSLRSISGLRHQPLTSFTLRDHALLLSPSNPDSCVSNRTAEEKYGARNIIIIYFLFYVLYFIGVGDDSPPEPAGEEEERTLA